MAGQFRRVAAWPAAVSMVACAVAAGSGAAVAAAPAPARASHDAPATARIGLAGADPDGLRSFALAVSDPHNAQYRHFLSPAQVRERFGPTAAQVAKVHAWVARAGLKITGENSHWVDVAGTPDQVAKAFAPGKARRAREAGPAGAAAATVPSALAGTVSSVAGLAPQRHGVRPFSHRVGPTRGLRGDPAPPADSPGGCSPAWGAAPANGFPAGYHDPETLALCAYVPSQLRAAYGVTASGFTGKGAVIGIVDAYGSPTMRADADQFATSVGDRPFADGQYVETVDRAAWRHIGDGVCETPATWSGEQALDVEMAHGLAPDAAVRYFGAASCDDHDIAATLARIVDEHAADTVTGAFGEIMHYDDGELDPSLVDQETKVFTAGAAEGIGFSFASGDCGDQAPGLTGPACDPATARAQTEWPASSPWVTAVGGTALAATASGQRQWEVAMGDLRSDLSGDGKSWVPFPGVFFFGGGGGTNEDFAQPAYQKGVVPDAVAHTVGGKHVDAARRTVPDVALNGDLLTAVVTGYTDPTLGGYGEDEVGGTSAAAPLFAAVQAVAAQAAGGPLGFANPALYQRSGTKAFNDVVGHPAGAPDPVSAVVDHGVVDGAREARLYRLDADHGLSAAAGYDTATGLGSPSTDYYGSYKK